MSETPMMLSDVAVACTALPKIQAESIEQIVLQGITTDSRADCTDQLFVALRGENFDAHDFIDQAEEQGARAVLIDREIETALPTLKVEDTLLGLGQIAQWWRSKFKVPVIGITGSVGKTTVKEMVASIFNQGGKGLVTQGNLNNEIGVPLTLLRFNQDDAYAVVEMGMSHAGEISYLSKLTKPTIAVVNNAAAAHLEGLGTIAAVAQAKGEIFDGLTDDGVAIINADDSHAQLWLDLAKQKQILTFGLQNKADVSAHYEVFKEYSLLHVQAMTEKFSLRLNVAGKHNVANALAAITIAVAVQAPVSQIINGLSNYTPINGRLKLQTSGQLTIIDDTYNANPASMRAAIDVLAQYSQATLIIGDMGELGLSTQTEHESLGKYIANSGISRVLACGDNAKFVAKGVGGVKGTHGKIEKFPTQKELLNYLAKQPVSSGAVLVKGSRSAKMENVVEQLITINEPLTEFEHTEEER